MLAAALVLVGADASNAATAEAIASAEVIGPVAVLDAVGSPGVAVTESSGWISVQIPGALAPLASPTGVVAGTSGAQALVAGTGQAIQAAAGSGTPLSLSGGTLSGALVATVSLAGGDTPQLTVAFN